MENVFYALCSFFGIKSASLGWHNNCTYIQDNHSLHPVKFLMGEKGVHFENYCRIIEARLVGFALAVNPDRDRFTHDPTGVNGQCSG